MVRCIYIYDVNVWSRSIKRWIILRHRQVAMVATRESESSRALEHTVLYHLFYYCPLFTRNMFTEEVNQRTSRVTGPHARWSLLLMICMKVPLLTKSWRLTPNRLLFPDRNQCWGLLAGGVVRLFKRVWRECIKIVMITSDVI